MSDQDMKIRRTKAVEGMAAAMMEYIEASEEAAERRANTRIDARFARFEQRLDRQDDTLRMMWKQMKGNGKLPIDEDTP